MWKRALLLLGGFLAVLGIGLAVALWLTMPPKHRIAHDYWLSTEKPRSGWTEQDFEDALGVPAGDYRHVLRRTPLENPFPGVVDKSLVMKCWIADDYVVAV